MNSHTLYRKKNDYCHLYRLCRTLIVIGIAFTPFAALKIVCLQIPIKMFLNYEEHLSMYPMLLFSIIWLIHTIKGHGIREYIPLGIFFIVYFIANMAVTIHGNLVFPFYDIVDFSKLEGAEKTAFQAISKLFPLNPDPINWIIINTMKTCLTTVTKFYSSYFIVFSILLFYRETSFNISDDIWLGITAILPVLAIYEIFEVAFLVGAIWGETALRTINPLLYEVESTNGWWPPILWPGQIRSVFQEPSFLSYWGVLCVPFFLRSIHKRKHFWISIFELAFISFIVLGSNSRTGTALLLGVICVYFIVALIIKQKRVIKVALLVFCIIAISLVSSVAILSTNIDSYFDNTLGTLTSTTARSNSQRFAMMKAQLDIFSKHPLLGVGEKYLSSYLADYFNKHDMDNEEIDLWVETTAGNGFISGGFPPLCEYTSALAAYGLLGSIGNNLVFIVMTCIVIFKGLSNRKSEEHDLPVVLSTCACIMAFGISGPYATNYFFFIVLAAMLSYFNRFYYKSHK